MTSRGRSRVTLSLLAMAGFASLAWASFVRPMPHMIYNASASVPVGWYRIEPVRLLHVGDIVLVRLPAGPAHLAALRGYLPSGIPLLKRIGARAPQQVCIGSGIVRINGMPVATTLPIDGAGRRLQVWRSCRRLRHGELFLLSTDNPASFDSRYFGPVPASAVIGRAKPLRIEDAQ